MPSRRRARTSAGSVFLVLGLAIAGYGLHAAGLLPPAQADDAHTSSAPSRTDEPHPSASHTGATGQPSATDAPDVATGAPSVGGAAEPSRASSPGPNATASLRLLTTLPVKGKAPATGYDRTADFGTAWLDVDHNGCDTRN
ncbi:hypothetical protein QT366_22745, partial [Xanthomonas citri pv. citri]